LTPNSKYETPFSNAFLRRLGTVLVAYDIGANTGYFSLLAASNSKVEVFSFEPMPNLVADLHTLVVMNHLADRVHVNHCALSNTAGTVRMVTPGSDATGLMETALRGQQVDREGGINVAAKTLDGFVFDEHHCPPELIKLDVEGAEAMVLQGARRVLNELKPTILVEVHGEPIAAEIWETADRTDYEIHLIAGADEIRMRDQDQWMRQFGQSKWSIRHAVLQPIVS
jgi:FkbM family methyltransferase